MGARSILSGVWGWSWLYLCLCAHLISWVCSLWSGLSPLHGHGIWDWGLTPQREGDELEQAIIHVRAQPAESTGILQGVPGVHYLKSKEVLSRDLPYQSAGCCLSSQPFLPRGCSLSLLCSLTAGGRRKWEPLCLVPARAHCFGSGGVSGLQLLCLWLGRPESVSDGVSAEQPLSPGVGKGSDPSAAFSRCLHSAGLRM